jgi:hypothetical protein
VRLCINSALYISPYRIAGPASPCCGLRTSFAVNCVKAITVHIKRFCGHSLVAFLSHCCGEGNFCFCAAASLVRQHEPGSSCSTEPAPARHPEILSANAAVLAISTAAVSTWAHDHIRAIFIALLAQSAMQLIPSIFLLLGSPVRLRPITAACLAQLLSPMRCAAGRPPSPTIAASTLL